MPARARRLHHTDGFAAALFLLPALIGFTVFVLVPVVAAFAVSLLRWDLLSAPRFVGLANFRRLLTDRVFHAALTNTAVYTLGTVMLSVLLGLACALLMTRAVRGIGVARTLLALPYVTVTVAMAIVWRWIFQPQIGPLNEFLAWFGIEGPNWLGSRTWALPALILMGVWKSFGYNMILFIAGLQTVPRALHEAAAIDGARAHQRLRHITLPLLSPIIFFVTVISVITSFEVFDAALVMTNGGPGTATTTLVLYIYQRGFAAFDFGHASAVALVLFAIVLTVTLIQAGLQRRWGHEGE